MRSDILLSGQSYNSGSAIFNQFLDSFSEIVREMFTKVENFTTRFGSNLFSGGFYLLSSLSIVSIAIIIMRHIVLSPIMCT